MSNLTRAGVVWHGAVWEGWSMVGMRARALVVGGALAMLGGMTATAHAGGVSLTSSDYTGTGACGSWDNPNPAPGTTEWISVCGGWSESTWSGTYVSTGMPPVQQGNDDSGLQYGLSASRQVCSTTTSECAFTTFYTQDVGPAEIAIDVEAGTARLRGTIQGCSIDVTVDAPDRFTDGGDLPHWSGIHYYPPASVSSNLYSHEGTYRSGSATGLACGWADLMGVPGWGTISEGTSRSDSVATFAP